MKIRNIIRNAAWVAVIAFAPLPAGAQDLTQLVGRELARMPYITVFDYLTYRVSDDGQVHLAGYTIRPSNKKSAERAIADIEGVSAIVNDIEILPASSFDRRIRMAVRGSFSRQLSRYFTGSRADIRIIVKNGDVWLYGLVDNDRDKNIATIQANSVFGVFNVHNELDVNGRVEERGKSKKEKKSA